MIKRICDICYNEIFTQSIAVINNDRDLKRTDVIIHREGRTLDICNACRDKLIRYAFNDMRGNVDPVNMGF